MKNLYMPALSEINKKFPDIESIDIQKEMGNGRRNPKLQFYVNTSKELSELEYGERRNAILGCLIADQVLGVDCEVFANDHEYSKDNCIKLILGNMRYSLGGLEAIKSYVHGERIVTPLGQRPLIPEALDW